MEPEFTEIELTPGETSAERTERLFEKHHGLSSGAALALLKLPQTPPLDSAKALVEKNGLADDKRVLHDRMNHYAMKAVGKLAKTLRVEPSYCENHLADPLASVVTLVEMGLPVAVSSYGLYGKVHGLELLPAHLLSQRLIEEYHSWWRGSGSEEELAEEDEKRKLLLSKPLGQLDGDDFKKLYDCANCSRQEFASLIATIAIFQDAQKGFLPQIKLTRKDDLLAEDRSEALQLVDRLSTALENPHVLQEVAADPKAKNELTLIFDRLGIRKSAIGNQPTAQTPEQP